MKHTYLCLFITLIIAVLSTGSVFAAESNDKGLSENQIVQGVQKKYESLKNFSADFTQETYLMALDQKRTLEGKVILSKPGKMSWIYLGENEQQIISNGKVLWYYQPNDKTVMVGELQGVLGGSVPFDFLSGMGNISKEFTVAKPDPEHKPGPGQAVLKLIPGNPMPNVSELSVFVNLKTFLLDKIVIYDAFGNATTLMLENAAVNRNIPDKTFEFKPPKDVEVIGPGFE